MSCKIVRPGDTPVDEVQAIQWRGHGQAGRIMPQTPRSGNAEMQTDGEQVKQLCAQAYQQGVAAGEAASAKRAQAKLDPSLASFSSMLTELTATRQKLRAEAETAAVALAIEVARRVLHREVAADPEAILGLVKAAFQRCDARATQRLHISAADADIIRQNQVRLNLPPGVEIASDNNLPRGSAIFETSRGDLDASVDTQLAEIERGLADVVKRRNP